jgi:hypothetical protein
MNESAALLLARPNSTLRQEENDGALQAHHCAHERVDQDQEPELAPVGPQPERDGGWRLGSIAWAR